LLNLLTVGRLSPTKRVETLVGAVQILHNSGRKVHFTIAGGGAMAQELRQTVSERGLSDVIEVAGRISSEKMPQIYRQNDIFVSASMQEGMSNAMLEAMASGLPIITTRCEGVEELVADNGIVVEEAQPEAIAEAIENLADDRRAYKQMSAAARKQAEQFSWKSVAERYLNLYNKVLKTAAIS
jgi:glycosyltransferase involved in cell wall biosynthesis